MLPGSVTGRGFSVPKRIRIRTRPNNADPTGSGSESTTRRGNLLSPLKHPLCHVSRTQCVTKDPLCHQGPNVSPGSLLSIVSQRTHCVNRDPGVLYVTTARVEAEGPPVSSMSRRRGQGPLEVVSIARVEHRQQQEDLSAGWTRKNEV